MIRSAFSTVACPTWTLERVAAAAAEWGYTGVELRSFGAGGGDGLPGRPFACDPALTAPAKVRSLLAGAGLAVAGVASGVRFDAAVFPPVLGHLLSASEAAVRDGRAMVNLASALGAGYLRVYAFDIPARERRASALRRICDRLALVCDHARNRDLRVLIENAGAFRSAADLAEIIDRTNSPILGVCYDLAAAANAGDSIDSALALLGPRLVAARLSDHRGGAPCPLGAGELPAESFVRAVAASAREWGSAPWVVYAWNRAFISGLAPAEDVLPGAAQLISQWGAGPEDRPGFHPTLAPQSVAPAMMIR